MVCSGNVQLTNWFMVSVTPKAVTTVVAIRSPSGVAVSRNVNLGSSCLLTTFTVLR